MSDERFTVVIIAYRKKRLNHRLIFGAPVFTIRRGWRRELAAFEPGQVFAYERWRGDKYGTQDWRLFICAAVDGGSVTNVPGVKPGADVLLQARGRARVKRALAAIDLLKSVHPAIEKLPVAQWREVHNTLETGGFRNEITVRAEKLHG
jgi:Protein of unknown function (DUF2840)